jgi:hypothetical protein
MRFRSGNTVGERGFLVQGRIFLLSYNIICASTPRNIGEKAFQKWPKITRIAISAFLGGSKNSPIFVSSFFHSFFNKNSWKLTKSTGKNKKK